MLTCFTVLLELASAKFMSLHHVLSVGKLCGEGEIMSDLLEAK